MIHRLLYIALGGVAVIVAKGLTGGSRPVVKEVYKGIARLNRGFERATAELREDLEDARREVEQEEATQQPVV